MYSAKRNQYPFVVFVGFCSKSYPVHHQTLCRQKKFVLRPSTGHYV